MNDETNSPDLLNEVEQQKPKLNSGLNVLTILTFVGCGVFGLLTLLMPMIYGYLVSFMDKAIRSGQELSEKQMAKLVKGKEALELAQQNMVPLMIIGLVGIVLCFLGALWMRRLRKDGYWLYVAGEILPLVGSAIVMGTSQFDSIMSVVTGLGVPLAFVVLYTIHRKYLVK